mgnify:CR=1 FL=1
MNLSAEAKKEIVNRFIGLAYKKRIDNTTVLVKESLEAFQKAVEEHALAGLKDEDLELFRHPVLSDFNVCTEREVITRHSNEDLSCFREPSGNSDIFSTACKLANEHTELIDPDALFIPHQIEFFFGSYSKGIQLRKKDGTKFPPLPKFGLIYGDPKDNNFPKESAEILHKKYKTYHEAVFSFVSLCREMSDSKRTMYAKLSQIKTDTSLLKKYPELGEFLPKKALIALTDAGDASFKKWLNSLIKDAKKEL